MKKIVGIVLSFGAVIAIMALGGNLSLFLDIPSLLFVVAIIMGALIYRYGFKGVVSEWGTPSFCKLARTSSLIAGLLGPIVGGIHIVHSFNDPKTIAPAVAVAILTLLYSIMINLFFTMIERES